MPARPQPGGYRLDVDRKLPKVPERPCACCRKPFKPTLRRRLLCALCFRDDGEARPHGMKY